MTTFGLGMGERTTTDGSLAPAAKAPPPVEMTTFGLGAGERTTTDGALSVTGVSCSVEMAVSSFWALRVARSGSEAEKEVKS